MMDVGRFHLNAAAGLALAVAGIAAPALALAQPLPAAGHPGCYARIAYPPVYRTVTERIAGAPVVSYRDLPPVVEHYARQVLAAPARVEHQMIAPVYRIAWRWIEVPGPLRQMTAPPIYRTITERRLISPAHLAWRPGGAAHGFAQGVNYGPSGGLQARPTGEVLCRVLIPARYTWSRRRVLVSPGRTYTAPGPVRHVRVQDRVLVQPGRTVEHVIPATYRTVEAERTVRPASRQRVVLPGPARLVFHRVPVSPARYGWAPIVCAPHAGVPYRPQTRPQPTLAPRVERYGAPPATPAPAYGGYGHGQAALPGSGHAYRPDEILAPTPSYPAADPPTLVPAPYDVGHPARR